MRLQRIGELLEADEFPDGKMNTICTHLFFTLAAYNLVLLFKTKEAVKMMGYSVATIREMLFVTENRVGVYVNGLYGFFRLREDLPSLSESLP